MARDRYGAPDGLPAEGTDVKLHFATGYTRILQQEYWIWEVDDDRNPWRDCPRDTTLATIDWLRAYVMERFG